MCIRDSIETVLEGLRNSRALVMLGTIEQRSPQKATTLWRAGEFADYVSNFLWMVPSLGDRPGNRGERLNQLLSSTKPLS